MLMARLGRIEDPYSDVMWIVTVTIADVALAVSVIIVKLGPHDEKEDGLTESKRGLLTVRTTELVKGGAHLNESVAVPVPPEMVIGFVDQMALGGELVALTTDSTLLYAGLCRVSLWPLACHRNYIWLPCVRVPSVSPRRRAESR